MKSLTDSFVMHNGVKIPAWALAHGRFPRRDSNKFSEKALEAATGILTPPPFTETKWASAPLLKKAAFRERFYNKQALELRPGIRHDT